MTWWVQIFQSQSLGYTGLALNTKLHPEKFSTWHSCTLPRACHLKLPVLQVVYISISLCRQHCRPRIHFSLRSWTSFNSVHKSSPIERPFLFISFTHTKLTCHFWVPVVHIPTIYCTCMYDCVELCDIPQEMGIPDHPSCLLRNLYAGQEATVRNRHETTDWFQIGKGVHQSCILSPCLFNLYAEYIMRNAGLEEAQAGIKSARRNINNFRYTNDTTLMA